MDTTTLSKDGQLAIPKALREARGWRAGMSFAVEEVPQGLLLRPVDVSPFPPSSIDQVVGMAGYRGPALSDEDIARALEAEACKHRP